jgi:thiol-disulfide isomerase/thioredoxin
VRSPARAIVGASLVLAIVAGAPPPMAGAAGATGTDDRLQRLTEAFRSFEMRDLDGRRWTAGGLRGRVVVLDFWATWCAPCLADIPVLRRLQARFGAAGLQVIGVSLDVTDRRTLITWLNRHRIEWPQAFDERGYEGPFARQFGVVSLPMSVLADRHGRVVAANLRGDRLDAAVKALLE